MAAKKTCVYVTPHVGKYGAERSMASVIAAMQRRGFTPVVIMPKEGLLCEMLEEMGVTYHILPFKNWINIHGKPAPHKGLVKWMMNIAFAKKIARVLPKDVAFVHTNSIITSFGLQLAGELGVPHYQHVREFGDRDFNFTFDMGKKWSMDTLGRGTKKVICISNDVLAHYRDWLAPGKCVRIYNGIASRVVPTQKDWQGTLRIAMVGRLNDEKRQIDLIEAAKLLKETGCTDFLVDVYGDGDNREMLEEKVKACGMGKQFCFKGFCSGIKLDPYHLGVITSPNEAFGRVTVEYMMAGLAVVGANAGGTAEIVAQGETGLLYEPCNVAALADALRTLCEDRAKAQTMGAAGRVRAMEFFSEESYTAAVTAIYEQK